MDLTGNAMRAPRSERDPAAHRLQLELGNGEEPLGERATKAQSPEQYAINPETRTIERVIRRKEQGSAPVVNPVTPLPEGTLPRDLAEYAEHFLLRHRYSPTQRTGRQIRIVDMFSGCGGMSLGLRHACDAFGHEFVAVAGFDLMPAAVKVYGDNFGRGAGRLADLGTALFDDLRAPLKSRERTLRRELGSIDFLVAGPPCQGHSNLNNATRRDDPRNELYLRVARMTRICKPQAVLIENVVTVRNDKGRVVPRTKIELERLGYDVSEAIVDLRKIGVPQSRVRHVLFAYLPGRGSAFQGASAGRVVTQYECDPRTVRWAIGDLASRPAQDFLDTPAMSLPRTKARIDFLFDNDKYDLPDSQRPDCHRLKAHTYKSVYGRMRWDTQSPTITGGFVTMGRGRFVHPSERRTLTPREAARLQGFPDYFDFSAVADNRCELIEMIGNAVPPKLSYVFGLEYMR